MASPSNWSGPSSAFALPCFPFLVRTGALTGDGKKSTWLPERKIILKKTGYPVKKSKGALFYIGTPLRVYQNGWLFYTASYRL